MQAAQCPGQVPCDQLLEACGQPGCELREANRAGGMMGKKSTEKLY